MNTEHAYDNTHDAGSVLRDRESETSMVRGSLDRLDTVVRELFDALDGVLLPPAPESVPDENAASVHDRRRSALTDEFVVVNRRVRRAITEIENLLGRLAVPTLPQ